MEGFFRMKYTIFFALFIIGCSDPNVVCIDSGEPENPHPVLYQKSQDNECEWFVANYSAYNDLVLKMRNCNACHVKNKIPVIKSLKQDSGHLFKIQFREQNGQCQQLGDVGNVNER